MSLKKSTAGGWTAGGLFRYRCWKYLGSNIFRWLPGKTFSSYRNSILRIFGARVGDNVEISNQARIDYPWNLSVAPYVWIGENVWLYNSAAVAIGSNTVISHNTIICTGTHVIYDESFDLVVKPVSIGEGVWIAMGCFIHPGVSIDDDAVVGACSVVHRDVPANTVCAGNPCKPLRTRFTK